VIASAGRRALNALSLLVAVLTPGCRGADLDPAVTRPTEVAVETLRPPPGALTLPLAEGSVRFAVIGDAGRGDQPQHEVARQMEAWREKFPFDFVLMLGDNIYPPHGPDDYRTKFEQPYRALLDAGVTFHAAIGNHDEPNEIYYRPFNMSGQRYYTFRRAEHRLAALTGAGVRFYALDSRSFDGAQLDWLRRQLATHDSTWTIAYFHHPLYTSGRYASAARSLRRAVEPILVNGDVDLVLSGHEHFYERIHPQHGIVYFVSGAGGSLREGDIRQTPLTARGFDTDYSFILMEITGETLHFQAISRAGLTVDAGVVTRGRTRDHLTEEERLATAPAR
jgi:Calcineurin-like phosphoesterase